MHLWLLILLSVVVLNPVHAQESISIQTQNAVQKVKDRLPLLHISSSDLANFNRWELMHTLPQVENLIQNPLEIPEKTAQWSETIIRSSSSFELLSWAQDTFYEKSKQTFVIPFNTPALDPAKSGTGGRGWTRHQGVGGLARHDLLAGTGAGEKSVSKIFSAIETALPILKASSIDLSQTDKYRILKFYDFPAGQFFEGVFPPLGKVEKGGLKTPQFKKQTLESLKKFSSELLLQSAQIVMKAVDDEIPNIAAWSGQLTSTASFRFSTHAGDVLISGIGDDTYTEQSLKNVLLLIDAGGNNRYEGSTAGAKDGEFRIVIDLGKDVTIISTGTSLSAGAGIFGIGLLYLPNSEGTKTILTDSYSQGMGLCGVGGLFVNGQGTFQAQRYAQGVGAFGVGIFSNQSGNSSEYRTTLYGQGVGFTRGVGIFQHRGSHAKLLAGLVDPDPRESLGFTSLCQGVGYGPRGYAGGGVGLCVLQGSDNIIESSYFAQGAGYWHALGSFTLEGDSNIVKARRYDQGSGIHTAIGSFLLKGNQNHTINWGVGPAYGWDTGIGWAVMLGNENKIQTEWGSTTANIYNSRSFFVLLGNQNKLDLPGLGNAGFTRDFPDYAVSIIEGQDNKVQRTNLKKDRNADGSVFYSPWGLIHFSSAVLQPNVGLPKNEWLQLEQTQIRENEQINLNVELKKAENLYGTERIVQLVGIASSFSLDKKTPRKALSALLLSGEDQWDALLDAVDPADMEQFIQIRTVISILGRSISDPIIKAIEKEEIPHRKAVLMSLLGFVRAEQAIPLLLSALEDRDWRIRLTAIRVLGELFNKANGKIPGRLLALKSVERYLSAAFPGSALRESARYLNKMTFADAAGVLSLSKILSPSERLIFLDSAPEDVTTNPDVKKAERLLSLLKENKEDYLPNLELEIQNSEQLSAVVREKLLELLPTFMEKPPMPEPEGFIAGRIQKQGFIARRLQKPWTPYQSRELLHAAITALGKLGNGQDVKIIQPFLSHYSALVRDSASMALARLGSFSKPIIKQILSEPGETIKKVQSLKTITQSIEPSMIHGLESGLQSEDAIIRDLSLACLEQLQPELGERQINIRKNFSKDKYKQILPDNLEKIYLYGDF